MGHSIRALISTRDALNHIAQGNKHAHIIDLHEHLCLMPMISDLVDDLNGFNDGNRDIRYPYKDTLWFLSHIIEDKAKEASHVHPVAYIETDYAGGVGTQAAIAWVAGQVAFGPEKLDFGSPVRGVKTRPINRALSQLGVRVDLGKDEFDTVGLAKFREMDEWESEDNPNTEEIAFPDYWATIDEFRNLWDGSEPGWVLHHFVYVYWQLIFDFDEGGPIQEEIINLRKIVPELKNEKLPIVYKKLKGVARYVAVAFTSNAEADKVEAQAHEMNLRVRKQSWSEDGYLPINGESAQIIEDDELAKEVVAKMIAAGVKVIEVEIRRGG